MRVLPRMKRAIWAILAAAMLCGPVSALAQAEPGSALDTSPISLKDGRLTINVRDDSLSRVLREIADKGSFALNIFGELDSEVSVSFENIPIEQALQRILGRSSYIVEMAQPTGADAPRRIVKLSVFPTDAPKPAKAFGRPPTKRRKSSATKGRAD